MQGTHLRGHAGCSGLNGVAEAALEHVPGGPGAQSAVAEGALDNTTVCLPLEEAREVELLVAGAACHKGVTGLGRVAQRALLGQGFFLGCCLLCHASVLATEGAIEGAVTALLSVAVCALQNGLTPWRSVLSNANSSCTCDKHGDGV